MKPGKKKNTKEDNSEALPGYPHYPQEEDILNTNENKTVRIPVDLENLSRNTDTSGLTGSKEIPPSPDMENRDDLFVEGTDADVTEEDMQALGPRDLSMDLGEDEMLKQRSFPVDMAGSDLDVPGAELDDPSEMIGNEDEENNLYSLGGDSKD